MITACTMRCGAILIRHQHVCGHSHAGAAEEPRSKADTRRTRPLYRRDRRDCLTPFYHYFGYFLLRVEISTKGSADCEAVLRNETNVRASLRRHALHPALRSTFLDSAACCLLNSRTYTVALTHMPRTPKTTCSSLRSTERTACSHLGCAQGSGRSRRTQGAGASAVLASCAGPRTSTAQGA
jgi:hypothetical protein